VLARGYSVTVLVGPGAPARDAAALRPGDRLRTRFASGEAASVVESVETGDAAGRRHPAEEVFHGG
jgi:exonuclease VII large subunit